MCGSAACCTPVDDGPGRIEGAACSAVGSVGIARESRNAFRAVKRGRQCKGILLIWPTPAAAFDGYRKLAARQDHGAAAIGQAPLGKLGVELSYIARLALEGIAKHDHVVAEAPRKLAGGEKQVAACRDELETGFGENRIAGFGRFVCGVGQRRLDRWGNGDPVL